MTTYKTSLGFCALSLILMGSCLLTIPSHVRAEDNPVVKPEIRILSVQPTGLAISPLLYGLDYTWTNAPFSMFTGVADPYKDPTEVKVPSWVASTQDGQIGLLATFNRYPGGFDGEWFDWTDYLATMDKPNPINHMDCTGKSCQSKYTDGGTTPGTPPDFFLTKMEPFLPYDAPGTNSRANKLVTDAYIGPRNASFQLPVHQVVKVNDDLDQTGETWQQINFQSVALATQADLDAAVLPLVQQYMQIISHYNSTPGQQVIYWELGNEWWNQGGTIQSNLMRYAYLVEKAVPVIKASFPNVRLYVTAEWMSAGAQPKENDQFKQLIDDMTISQDLIGENNLCGHFYSQGSKTYEACLNAAGQKMVIDSEGHPIPRATAWDYVDGISIHSYCGNDPFAKCANIPGQVRNVMTSTGKSDIYASEWSVSNGLTTIDNVGIDNASETMLAFRHMVHAGITEAAYWPVVDVGGHGLLTNNYTLSTTGNAFQLLSWLYEGTDLYTTLYNEEGNTVNGATEVIAAANYLDSPGFGIFVLTRGDGPQTINIPLNSLHLPHGHSPTKVTYSSLLTSSSSHPTIPELTPLNISIVTQSDGNRVAQFTLSPSLIPSSSDYNWEIATVELQ